MRIEGLDRLQSAFNVFPTAAQDHIRAALIENGTRLRELAKALAPVDEGVLKASIAARQGPDGLSVIVSAGDAETMREYRGGQLIDNAVLQEHDGTSYFFAAYRSLRKSFRTRLNRAIRLAAQQTFRG